MASLAGQHVLAPLQCTGLFKQVWERTVTEPLTLLEVQWPSLQVRWRHSHFAQTSILYWCERLALGGCGRLSRLPSTRSCAPRNIECISMTTMFFARPYRSDQSDALGHKWHIFLHNKHRRTKVESKTGAVELAELSHIQYWNIPVNIFLGVEWRESKYNSLALIHNYLKL